MRWILLLASLLCAGLMFVIGSPGWLALDLLGMLLFATAAVFAFAAERIDTRSQLGVSLLTPAELAELKQRRAAPPAASPVSTGHEVSSSIAALRARSEARRRHRGLNPP